MQKKIKRHKKTRRFFLILLIIGFLSPTLLFFPFFQNVTVQLFSKYSSQLMGRHIEVGKVYFSFPFNLKTQNLLICNTPKEKDTLFFCEKLSTQLKVIPLFRKRVMINHLNITEGSFHYLLDTISSKDTTPLDWKIDIHRIKLTKIKLHLKQPDSTSLLKIKAKKFLLQDISFNLVDSIYQIKNISLDSSTFFYSQILKDKDLNLRHLNFVLDTLLYTPSLFSGALSSFSVEEKSGITISSLTSQFYQKKDDLLPTSKTNFLFVCPFDSYCQWLTDSIVVDTTNVAPLYLDGFIQTTNNKVKIDELHVFSSESFDWKTKGTITNPMNEKKRIIKLLNHCSASNLRPWIRPFSNISFFQIPSDFTLKQTVDFQKEKLKSQLLFTHTNDTLTISAEANLRDSSYHLVFEAQEFGIESFFPSSQLENLTATIELDGKGLDPREEGCRINYRIAIDTLFYKKKNCFENFLLTVFQEENQGTLNVLSRAKTCNTILTTNYMVDKKQFSATTAVDVKELSLSYLFPSISFPNIRGDFFATFNSNYKKKHSLNLVAKNLHWQNRFLNDTLYSMKVQAKTVLDSSLLTIRSGDLYFSFFVHQNIDSLWQKFNEINKGVVLFENMRNDIPLICSKLPKMSVELESGNKNSISQFAAIYNLQFDSLFFNFNLLPHKGVESRAFAKQIQLDTIRFDSTGWHIKGDSLLNYFIYAQKNTGLKKFLFTNYIKGTWQGHFLETVVNYKNSQDEVGVNMHTFLTVCDSGYHCSFDPKDFILAFNQYAINDSNYLFYDTEKQELFANLRFTSDQAGSFYVASFQDSLEGNKLNVGLNKLPLEPLSDLFPQYPHLSGSMSSDLTYVKVDSSFVLDGQLDLDNLHYEGVDIGNYSLTAFYLPGTSDDHQLSAFLSLNDEEVVNAQIYYAQRIQTDTLWGDCAVSAFPLSISRAFVSEKMLTLYGALSGNVNFGGTTDRPLVTGSFVFDSTRLFLPKAGLVLRPTDKAIFLKNNKISFDKYEIYTHEKIPFVIDGTVDLLNEKVALSLRAKEYPLLSAKRTKESLLYGTVFMNCDATINGSLNALLMRGDIRFLGNSNVTYVLTDSPLSIQDRLDGLVEFVSFADTSSVKKAQKVFHVEGVDMLMNLKIDPSVQMNVELANNNSSYINLEGGGDLTIQITPQGNQYINGIYELSNGKIKYNLPAIPLKNFTIQEGSFVKWLGKADNPQLHLIAKERVKCSVAIDEQTAHPVNFDISVILSQTLQNMSLNFDVNTNEDLSVSNDLESMSEEERNLIAITMLVTNTYQSKTANSNKNMLGNALNAFLQNQINNVAGNMLQNAEISVGLDSYGQQDQRTDYSFSFAKRFYNDRIRIMLGGRLSTGEESSQTQSFIDNVSIEYRLDNTGRHAVRLFHERNYEGLLEGEITRTGTGIVFRKKANSFKDLFRFKKKKK